MWVAKAIVYGDSWLVEMNSTMWVSGRNNLCVCRNRDIW